VKSKRANPSSDYSPLDDFERRYVRPKSGRTLIVGSQVYGEKEDRRKRYSNVVGVDMLAGPGVDVVANLEEPVSIGAFAHIECMSVLEHSARPWLLAGNLETLLEPGGTIFVTVPFIWRYHGYPSDFWRFTIQGIRALFSGIEWRDTAYGYRTLIGEKDKIPLQRFGGYPFYPRTETFAFGFKR